MPGPNSGVHGLKCVDKVVLLRLWWLTQLLFQGARGVRTSTSSRFSVLSLFGVSPCSSCLSLLSRFRVVLAALLEWTAWGSGAPGSSAGLPPGRSVEEGQQTVWCVGVCGALLRCIPTRGKGVCHHTHHSTHTESALHSSAITRATHTCYATARVASVAHNPRRCVLARATRSDAQRSAAQRSTARASSTCTTETQCTHMHMCRAQSCRLVSPPPSSDHLPFSGSLAHKVPCVQSVYMAAGVAVAALRQGTRTRNLPTRVKGSV